MKTITRFHDQLAALPHFVVLAAPQVPPETNLKAMVRDILEGAPDRIYRDGVESVDSAALDENGDLIGEFSDRIGVRAVKRFQYKITDDSVQYWLINPKAAARFSAYQTDVLAMFAPATTKKKNCAKSIPCGNSCIASGKTCRKGGTALSPKTKTKIKAAKVAAAAPAVAPPSAPKTPANQPALDNTRNKLIQQYGVKTVEDAEANLKSVINDADVFVRVRSAETLQNILGDEFKNSFQLGQDTHQIPQLADKSYLKARARVEDKTLGIDTKTVDGDRPIYGYLGSKDLNGASHSDPSRAYGSIAIKLKGDVKDRATFTGADSFKSGIASAVKNDGTPPPPNAASIIPATRHGYDRAKLPAHYPSYYADDSNDGSFLKAATKAKSVDDLAPKLATTGNAYMEAQIHGGLKPSDIAEIHFNPGGISDRPNAAIAQFAKDNGVDLYVRGKKLSPTELDGVISQAADPVSQRVKDLQSAMESGDFTTVRNLGKQIYDEADQIRLNPGEEDRVLKLLYEETGFDGFPKVGTEADVTQAWQNGGHLMVRGVSKSGKDGKQYLNDFQNGDYFVGNGVYGNGTYVGHAGTVPYKGKTVVGYNSVTHKIDAKRAVDDVEKHGYISKSGITMRMALSKDAVVVTQSELLGRRNKLVKQLDADLQARKTAILGSGSSTPFTKSDVSRYNSQTSKNRLNFAGTKIQTKTVASKPRNGGTQEEQEWTIKATNGETITKTVFVDKHPAYPATAHSLNADSSRQNISIGKSGRPISQSHFNLVEDHGHEKILANNGWKIKPRVGDYNLDPADVQKIASLDDEHEVIKHVLGLNDKDMGALGRFAVLQRIDMLALDQSYEPLTFGNLLNRSKVVIQKDPLDYRKAMKTGAL